MAKKAINSCRSESVSPFESAKCCDAVASDIRFVLRREPDPNWKVSNLITRDYYVLAYADSGRAWYECEGKKFSISRGQLLFFPKGTMRSGKADPKAPWSFIATGFDVQCFDETAAELLQSLPRHFEPGNDLEVNSLFTELEHRWVARDMGYLFRCRSIIMHLLYILLRLQSKSHPSVPHARRIAPIVRLMQDKYTHSYSVDELARMADLSPSRFSVLFKQLTGHTVVRYQNWLRINKAKDLLSSGEYTVTETARETGFEDVYYFSRLFKKLTGNTPSFYRED